MPSKADSKIKRTIVTIDPSLEWDRRLKYREKHSGWEIFKSIYWGIYIFALGLLLLVVGPTTVSYTILLGWIIILLSIFVVIYGFVLSLHYKLLKKHG